MPALNFQKQFAPAILAGTKCQTIRAHRKDCRPHALPGQQIKLFTGMRTKACQLLTTVECTGVEAIAIHKDGISLGDGTMRAFWMHEMSLRFAPMLEAFAQADGFANWPAMRDWFSKTHTLPFEGSLIVWKPLPSPTF